MSAVTIALCWFASSGPDTELFAQAEGGRFQFDRHGRVGGDVYRNHPQYGRTDQLKFEPNKFTFCRIRYRSHGRWGRGGWRTDWPESDYNFSLRLSQLTTIDVNMDQNGEPVYVDLPLTDPQLFNYPWIYMLEVGSLYFTDEEAHWLREYLLRGGFLFVDDFWGEAELANWEYEIAKVFPPNEYPMKPIPIDHEIFRCVFKLDEMPQIPSINSWMRTGVTYERHDAKIATLYGIEDKKGRLMVVVAHNTDLGDGWERETVSREYFEEFSAKKAYPLGINIVVYAMTH
jgi:hypothetical protein